MYNLDAGKCVAGNQVVRYCHTQKCSFSPLICEQAHCQCQNHHRLCNDVIFSKTFIKNLQGKKDKGNNFLQNLLTYVDSVIKKFTILKEDIQKLDENEVWMLEKQESLFFNFLKQSNYNPLNSLLVSTVVQSLNKQYKDSSKQIQQNINLIIKEADTSIQKLIKLFEKFANSPQNQIQIPKQPIKQKIVVVRYDEQESSMNIENYGEDQPSYGGCEQEQPSNGEYEQEQPSYGAYGEYEQEFPSNSEYEQGQPSYDAYYGGYEQGNYEMSQSDNY